MTFPKIDSIWRFLEVISAMARKEFISIEEYENITRTNDISKHGRLKTITLFAKVQC